MIDQFAVLSTNVIVLLVAKIETLPIVMSYQSCQGRKHKKPDDENYATSLHPSGMAKAYESLKALC
jgi:hypothetical protein